MPPPKVVKCPKCGQNTPVRSGSCLYCGEYLDEQATRAVAQPGGEKLVEEPRQLGGGPRFQKTYDGRGHYLFLGAREPILLEPNKLFVIGRDPHASLVIHSPEVSRQHCEIDWKGDPARPMLVEVRARNGTYLNDKPLRRGEAESLRDRDVIRIAQDFEVVYRQMDERELKETLNESGRADTRAIRLPQPTAQPFPVPQIAPQAPAAPAALIPDTGDLSQIPGGVLLEALHRERRSGVLTVFDGQTAGEVHLQDGRAKVAVFGSLQSRDALEHIARVTRGAYRFVREAHATAAMPNLAAFPGLVPPPPTAQQPAIPAELLAQLQRIASSPAPAPAPAIPASVPPELAALLAAATSSMQQQQQPPAPQAPVIPNTLPFRNPSAGGPIAPLKGASEPTAAQIAAVLGQRPPTPPTRPMDQHKPPTQQMRTPPAPPGSSTGARSRSDVLPRAGERPSPTAARPRPAEPLRTPSDPYVTAYKAPSQQPPAAAAPYAAPSSGGGNGDSPEAREANALLATVRAVGLAGDALGSFVGDTFFKLLDDGQLGIALELGERGLELADKGSFEAALATRMAFKTRLKSPQKLQRALELVERGAQSQGPAWAARAAERTLRLVDPETPPDPRDGSVLGRLAAIAKR